MPQSLSTAIGKFKPVREYGEEFNTRLADLGFQVDLKCCVEDKIELDFENELSAILFQDETRLVDVTT